MVVLFWSVKGGSGVTVVAAASALLSPRRTATTLVDLGGDVHAALGLPDPIGPGVLDWLDTPNGTADGLFRLAADAADGLTVIGAGPRSDPSVHRAVTADDWDRLVTACAGHRDAVIVDAGRALPPPAAHHAVSRSLLVTRPCFLALRRAAPHSSLASGIVLVDEPGRALRADDVERALGTPVEAELQWDPAVARAVDAGLLASRLPHGLVRRLRNVRDGGRSVSTVVYGLGPLERWIADGDVTEIMVNAGTEVWIERHAAPGGAHGPQYAGRLDPGVVEVIIERILAPVGRRLDRTSPIVDTRLPDGSRLCAVLPPVAVDGPCLSLRRFAATPIPLDAFAAHDVCVLLRGAMTGRCNVLVSGATSSGKTTLLNALAGLVEPHPRLVTLEDTAELRLDAPHVLRLEARPASADGVPAVDVAALLHTALRLRPDRLVVGEIRGDEAMQLVAAMNTGHDGSLATIHANSPLDALARVESLVVRASPAWSLPAVREQVRRSIDVVVHVARAAGSRRITTVAEVVADGDIAVRVLAQHDHVVGELERRRT